MTADAFWSADATLVTFAAEIRSHHARFGGGRDGACAAMLAFAAVDSEISGAPFEVTFNRHVVDLARLRLGLPADAHPTAVEAAATAHRARFISREPTHLDAFKYLVCLAWAELDERVACLEAEIGGSPS